MLTSFANAAVEQRQRCAAICGDGEEVTIRHITDSDVEAISSLVSTLSRRYITPGFTAEGTATLLNHQTPAAIRSVIEKGTRYWVADRNGDIVGAVAITRSGNHLYHMFVAETYQRQGLGRRLWEHARQACTSGIEPQEFTVNSSRYAVPFYRSLGFVEVGPLDHCGGVICQPMRLKLH